MKKLKDLTVEELGALYKHNQQFANAVYEDAFQCNMNMQTDEFNNMGAKVFDYHDHYNSFYLTTPMQYGVRNAHAIAHKLNDEFMSDKARHLYDELNKLADEYDHFEADPKYLVREITRDEEGNIIYDECLEEFVMYEEAKQFIKEMENK